jgi:putative CocE/NonD family hydrolase
MSDERYAVEVRYDVRIPMRDGLELSANLFLPVARTPGERFPAILEMIPYRKDDWRFCADQQRMTYFAQRGYVGCRLDIRGTGSSPGIARDEYTPEETQDGYDAVEWLAAQPWCNGNVGMWGISYGGFTAIQVAMLQPPSLKAIVPMYATDDRYTDDVHYNGGCMTGSEMAQYAVSQVAMNAMPPRAEFMRGDWAAQWRARLEQPPWLLQWLHQQTDGSYWRSGSLAPNYDRISCAIFHIGGWADSYTSPVLRMQERCVNAPRKALIGPWVHSLPDSAYPGPNIDYLHEMVRFFDHWLKGEPNGVMDEPALVIYRQEYTPPEAFPARVNGAWHAEPAFPIARTQPLTLVLGAGTLEEPRTENQEPRTENRRTTNDERRMTNDRGSLQASHSMATPISDQESNILHSQFSILNSVDTYPHRPTHGTRAALCWGGGSAPNGLARDLRPDEALIPTYTSAPLDAPLDIIGFPEAILYLSSSAPIAHVVVRLNDVAPNGVSAPVCAGILNLTHRDGHADPQPLVPGEVYEVRVPLKAAGYRFLPGHRIRLSVASAYWPAIWPSPYPSENAIHRGPGTPSRLILPVVPPAADLPAPPEFKTTPPELIAVGGSSEDPPIWKIVEDVIAGSVTVEIYGGDTTVLPEGRSLFNAEHLLLTAYERDPAHVQFVNTVDYRLVEHGYETYIRTSGTIRSTANDFHVDIELRVELNGNLFFHKSWLESIPRRLL